MKKFTLIVFILDLFVFVSLLGCRNIDSERSDVSFFDDIFFYFQGVYGHNKNNKSDLSWHPDYSPQLSECEKSKILKILMESGESTQPDANYVFQRSDQTTAIAIYSCEETIIFYGLQKNSTTGIWDIVMGGSPGISRNEIFY